MFHIATTEEKGRGLFAKRKIFKDEHVIEIKSVPVDVDAVEKEDEQYLLQVDTDRYVRARNSAIFINHSCEPNTGIRENSSIVAIKDIEEDEELCFDYSTTMDEDDWTMECRCGNKNCRGLIRDFKYLSNKQKVEYLRKDIVMSFIAEQYDIEKISF